MVVLSEPTFTVVPLLSSISITGCHLERSSPDMPLSTPKTVHLARLLVLKLALTFSVAQTVNGWEPCSINCSRSGWNIQFTTLFETFSIISFTLGFPILTPLHCPSLHPCIAFFSPKCRLVWTSSSLDGFQLCGQKYKTPIASLNLFRQLFVDIILLLVPLRLFSSMHIDFGNSGMNALTVPLHRLAKLPLSLKLPAN